VTRGPTADFGAAKIIYNGLESQTDSKSH
jgi:hypothetical protein